MTDETGVAATVDVATNGHPAAPVEVEQGPPPEDPSSENEPLDLDRIAADEADPPDVEDAEDGTAIILEKQKADAPEPTKVIVEGKRYRVRKLGTGEIGEIIVGEYRKAPQLEVRRELDKLKTADRMFLLTIQKCVVKKDGRTPLWTPNQVLTMHGSDDQAKYKHLLERLYEAAINENPTLLPALNPAAMKILYGWF